MIGKQTLVLGYDKLVSGMASSDFANDGALGTSSFGINPFAVQGIVRSTVTPTDKTTNLVATMIASCEDSQGVSSDNALFVDNAANYYGCNSVGTLTKRKTGSATTHYTFGKTDMASFALNTYVTLDNDIALWNTSANSLDETWWTVTKSQSALDSTLPHPFLVFENLLWVADGPNLNSITASGTVTIGALTLNTSERIYALGIDPSTGLMMIAVQQNVNISDTLSSRFYIYLYDGYSSKPRRKIPVDDLVTAFHNVGGTTYVGYGQRLGSWNGNGITFLRKLSNVTLSSADLAYKHHFSHVGNVLMVVDGANVLAYGEVAGGAKKAFYYIQQNPEGSSHKLSIIGCIGGTTVAMASSTPKFYVFDLMGTGAGGGVLAFNNIYFPRPIFVRRIRVITSGVTVSGVTDMVMTVTDQNTAALPISSANRIRQVTVTTYVFDFDYTDAKVLAVQPMVTFGGNNYGVVQVIIYYDVAE